MDQRQLRGQEVQGAGERPRPGAITPPCQTPVGGDPLDRDRRAARDDQAGPARPACSREAARTASARSAPPVSAPFDVLGDRDLGRRSDTRRTCAPACARQEVGRAARPAGGLTVAIGPGRGPPARPVPVVPDGVPGRRVVERQGDRCARAGRRGPTRRPLEPRVAHVGDDAEHGHSPAAGGVDRASTGRSRRPGSPATGRRRLGRGLDSWRAVVRAARRSRWSRRGDPLAGDGRDRQHLAAQFARRSGRGPRRRRSGPSW